MKCHELLFFFFFRFWLAIWSWIQHIAIITNKFLEKLMSNFFFQSFWNIFIKRKNNEPYISYAKNVKHHQNYYLNVIEKTLSSKTMSKIMKWQSKKSWSSNNFVWLIWKCGVNLILILLNPRPKITNCKNWCNILRSTHSIQKYQNYHNSMVWPEYFQHIYIDQNT